MDRTFGRYIFLGLVIGAVLGLFSGAAISSSFLGIAVGALAGVFVGWFIAAARFQNSKDRL